MIGPIKDKAAKFIVKQKLKEHNFDELEFSRIFKRSYSYLVLMPQDEKDFFHAVKVLNFLKDLKKNVTAMTNDFRVSLLPSPYKVSAVDHGISDKTKLELPAKKFLNRIKKMQFDVVIDANRHEVLFYSFIVNFVNPPVRIGFTGKNADMYFNLQIVNNKNEPEISYQNLLNCLKMF
jgi:ADP-heptose:LPS heptosyltransferase